MQCPTFIRHKPQTIFDRVPKFIMILFQSLVLATGPWPHPGTPTLQQLPRACRGSRRRARTPRARAADGGRATSSSARAPCRRWTPSACAWCRRGASGWRRPCTGTGSWPRGTWAWRSRRPSGSPSPRTRPRTGSAASRRTAPAPRSRPPRGWRGGSSPPPRRGGRRRPASSRRSQAGVSSLDLGLCDWEARPRTSPGAAASSGQNCSRFCRRAPVAV